MITIKEPFWRDKAFGVAAKELIGESILVECSFKDRNGNYVYPHVYEITTSLARKHKTMVRKNTTLHIIPVANFTVESHRHADRDQVKEGEE